MSHCFGARCATHQRIMSDNTCPERGCPGNHGWTDVDCDDRCPDFALEQFKQLLDQSSFGDHEEGAPPHVHAMMDQILARKRDENRDRPTAT